MPDEYFRCDCVLCKRSFKFSNHTYDGKKIPVWNVMICKTCLSSNHDGIVPESYPELIAQLESAGIEIQLNKKGCLDIPR